MVSDFGLHILIMKLTDSSLSSSRGWRDGRHQWYARLADGSSGKPGAYEGGINVRDLGLDGRQTDLEASSPFALPDQCQMLLGQANELFFSNTDDGRQSASDVYRSLISRLAFLDTISEDHTASKVQKAYNQLKRNGRSR